jgi:heme/copper-type cytochrome/quinol oxidase subunit 4
MPTHTSGDELANHRRTWLLCFYLAAILSAIALCVVGSNQSLHTPLLFLSVAGAAAAVWFLLRFLRSNDERERQINYRALTFAFTGTLVFSLAIGFLQSFGFHSVSWLGIPALMVVLWSIGLILYSWRYQ